MPLILDKRRLLEEDKGALNFKPRNFTESSLQGTYRHFKFGNEESENQVNLALGKPWFSRPLGLVKLNKDEFDNLKSSLRIDIILVVKVALFCEKLLILTYIAICK